MRRSAPADLEGSSLCTLLSGCSPEEPATQAADTTQETADHKPRRKKSKRPAPKRHRSADTVVEDGDWEDAPPASLPRPVQHAHVQCLKHRLLGRIRSPRVNPADFPVLSYEARQRLPRLGAPPTVVVRPPAPEVPPLPKWQTDPPPKPPVSSPSIKRPPQIGTVAPPPSPNPGASGKSNSPAEHPEHYTIINFWPDRLKTSQEQPAIGYTPFVNPNFSHPLQPKLNRHAAFRTLQDCWASPDAELSAQFMGRRNPGAPAGAYRHRKKNSDAERAMAAESARLEGEGEGEGEGTDEGGTLVEEAITPSPETSPSPPPSPVSDPAKDSTTRLAGFGKALYSPLKGAYKFVSKKITTHLDEVNAHAGELGSHDTKTAYWLRKTREEERPSGPKWGQPNIYRRRARFEELGSGWGHGSFSYEVL